MKLAHRSVLKQIRLIQYLQNVLKYNHDDAVKIGAQIVFYIDQSKRLTLVFSGGLRGLSNNATYGTTLYWKCKSMLSQRNLRA